MLNRIAADNTLNLYSIFRENLTWHFKNVKPYFSLKHKKIRLSISCESSARQKPSSATVVSKTLRAKIKKKLDGPKRG